MNSFWSYESRARWSDNDRHFGPFLFSLDRRYRSTAIVLKSGDDEYPGCSIRFSAFGFTLIIAIMSVIKPWRVWVDTSRWSSNPAGGYWDIHPREYGFSVSDGFLQLLLGRQTGDSCTEQSKSWFLPWTQWRFVRRSWYGLQGEHLRTDYETDSREVRAAQYETQRIFEASMRKVIFAFNDFDGEAITASTHIVEMEWRFGQGAFKWLSLFRRPKVKRSLDIEFSKETGKRKGSWKGGTMGSGIEMLPGDTHLAAFRRYCFEHNMTFVGAEVA